MTGLFIVLLGLVLCTVYVLGFESAYRRVQREDNQNDH